MDLISESIIKYFRLFYPSVPDGVTRQVVNIRQVDDQTFVFDGITHKYKNDSDAIQAIVGFVRNNLQFENSWNAYHGSIVKVRDKIVLFLGHSGSGKSTLSTFLSTKPDSFVVSEDISVINTNTLECVYRYVPIALRKPSYNLLTKEYNCMLQILGDTYNDKFIYQYPQVNIEKCVIDCCVLLNREKNTRTPRLSKVDGEKTYASNSFCHHTMFYNLKCAIKLSSRLPIYSMSYEDLNDAYEFLANYSIE